MTDDMGYDLKLPDVGELTFPQWRDWLVRYNRFIGERDAQYAAGLGERDRRIKKLEAALREIINLAEVKGEGAYLLGFTSRDIAKQALEETK